MCSVGLVWGDGTPEFAAPWISDVSLGVRRHAHRVTTQSSTQPIEEGKLLLSSARSFGLVMQKRFKMPCCCDTMMTMMENRFAITS